MSESLIEWIDRAEADIGHTLDEVEISMVGQFYRYAKTYDEALAALREADRIPQISEDEVPVNRYEPRGAEGVVPIPPPDPEAQTDV